MALGLWGTAQGYPDFYGHIDEIGVAASIWNFFRAETLWPTEFIYPDHQYYLVALVLWIASWWVAGLQRGSHMFSMAWSPSWIPRPCGDCWKGPECRCWHRNGTVHLPDRARAHGRHIVHGLRRSAGPSGTQGSFRYHHGDVRHRLFLPGLEDLRKWLAGFLPGCGRGCRFGAGNEVQRGLCSTGYSGRPPVSVVQQKWTGGDGYGLARRLFDRRLWSAVVTAIAAVFVGLPYLLLASKRCVRITAYQVSGLGFSLGRVHPWWSVVEGLVLSEWVLGGLHARRCSHRTGASSSVRLVHVGSLTTQFCLHRPRESALSASTQTDKIRESTAAEFNQSRSEIAHITKATTYNGDTLLTWFGSLVDSATSTAVTTSNATGVADVTLSAAAAGTYTLVD